MIRKRQPAAAPRKSPDQMTMAELQAAVGPQLEIQLVAAFAWVVEARISWLPSSLELHVRHHYPQGVSIRKPLIDWMQDQFPACACGEKDCQEKVGIRLQIERVSPC